MSEGDKRKKVYVLDTSAIIEQPYCLYPLSGNNYPIDSMQEEFEKNLAKKNIKWKNDPNDILIPDIVFRELDGMLHNEKGYEDYVLLQARVFNRMYEEIQESSETIEIRGETKRYQDLESIMALENDAKLIRKQHDEKAFLDRNIPYPNNDDRIISLVKELSEKNKDKRYILVSADVGFRNKAKDYGIEVQDLEFEKVSDINQLYEGISTHFISKLSFKDQILNRDSIILTKEEAEEALSLTLYQNHSLCFQEKLKNGESERVGYYIVKHKEDGNILLRPIEIDSFFMNYITKHNESLDESVKRIYSSAKTSTSNIDVQQDFSNQLNSITSLNKKQRTKLRKRIERLNPDNVAGIENLRKELMNLGGVLSPKITGQRNLSVMLNKLTPHNRQIPYINLLFDQDVQMMCVNGLAGTGKTYFALAAGIIQYLQGKYDGVVYLRPLVPASQDLGYMPGGYEEKLDVWLKPPKKNIRNFFSLRGANDQYKEYALSVIKKMEGEILMYEAMSYMGGDTLDDMFIYLDEAQVAKKELIDLVIGRAGQGSKLVFGGDINQLALSKGAENISKSKCGLAHAIETNEGDEIFSVMTLGKPEVHRSEVAKRASR